MGILVSTIHGQIHFIEWNYKQNLDWFLLDYDMHKKCKIM